MANPEHFKILKSGKESWNRFVEENWKKESGITITGPDGKPTNIVLGKSADLSGLDLRAFKDFSGYSFYKVNLTKCNLSKLRFKGCLFRKAKLDGAKIIETVFDHSNFDYCNLMNLDGKRSSFKHCSMENANLANSNFYRANFSNSKLIFTTLKWAQFIETKFRGADISNSLVFGASIWNCDFDSTVQKNIIITQINEPIISIDNIEIAQFVHLLINNKKIRTIIDTITTKVVLILGRFTDERLEILKGIKEELRKKDYLPILFDFKNADNRDLTETVSTLAHLSRFVIADLTSPKSIPQELSVIVPSLPSVPIQPIIIKGKRDYALFGHWLRYPSVLEILEYSNLIEIKKKLLDKMISNAEEKAIELKKNIR